MDGIQGAVLSIKLRHLDQANQKRRAHAKRYDQGFSGLEGITTPVEHADCRHVYHIYAIRVADRDQVMRKLQELGIGTGIHYPVPIHLQECYRSLGLGRGSFSVAEKCADEFLSLPMFPELTELQIERVIEAVTAVVPAAV